MYRTYRNLYRIRPAITAIGQGRHRIRLPKGFQITVDMFLLSVVLWLPMAFVAKLFFSDLVPLPSPLTGLILAGAVSLKLEKLDPSGKSMMAFLKDILSFVFRGKHTDGFEPKQKLQSFKIGGNIPVGLIEDNKVASLPASGYVTDFALNSPLQVHVSKDGQVTVGYKVKKGETLPKGVYSVKDGQVFKRKK